jgi:deoxyribodipyrimidine photolyase-related protein
MKDSKSLFLLQGDHLFPPSYLKGHNNDLFLMIEDREYLKSHKFHKHKIVFNLCAMRHYARELKHADYNLLYFDVDEAKNFSKDDLIEKVLKESRLKKITSFEIEDKAIEKQLQDFCSERNLELEFLKSPLFILSREDFINYLEQFARPTVKSFYEHQRRKLKILMDPNGEPLGGSFSFEDEERIRWHKKTSAPKIPISVRQELELEVIHLVDQQFADHHGDAHTSWYPTTREAAQEALHDFCKYRLAEYGPYEESLCTEEDFLFHSVLSLSMNSGLLLPHEVLKTAIKYADDHPVPFNSLESFTKKILGHREYTRGIYQNFSDFLEQSNFWKHDRLPNQNWYQGTTLIPPLDDAIKKAKRLAYNHHTERLKIVCNMMNLSELNPYEAYRWFNEMQMDSCVWALEPNVYGLGLHSDGGIFANKLHICSSNYWLKISNYEKEDWCLEVDGLYWRFIDRHQDFFSKNPRLTVVANNLEKMPADRKELLDRAANAFLQRNTSYP